MKKHRHRLSKSYGFSVVMYRFDIWTLKKAEHWRIDAFELWCWKRLLSPLDSKEIQPANPKGNQSWIFIGRTDAEALLASWCKEVTHWKRPWCWERLRTEGGNRGWDGWMSLLTQWTWVLWLKRNFCFLKLSRKDNLKNLPILFYKYWIICHKVPLNA